MSLRDRGAVAHPGADHRRRDLLGMGLVAAWTTMVSQDGVAAGDDAAAILATYTAFVTAQNAGDLDTVRSLFTEEPRFLWVSDGQSIWGRDEAIARMSLFRASEVWRVTPDLGRAVPVLLGPGSAYLHLPLDLEIGSRQKADRLPFLVSMLCHRRSASESWRIAALFTTARKTT